MPVISTFGAMSSRAFGGIGGGGRGIFELPSALTNQKQLNLETYLTGQGWNGKDAVNLVIPSGVYIWSDSTSVAGLTISSAFNNLLTITNNGYIIGRGGNGGSGGSGQSGGSAISNSATGVVLINASGAFIAGGGGGGGGPAGGGGAGGGTGGAGGSAAGGSGGAIGSAGASGGRVGTSYPYEGQGGGSGGAAGVVYGGEQGGGGGGGRILPGVGGHISNNYSGNVWGNDEAGNGGDAGNAGENWNANLVADGAANGGGGGGGWGASGGSGNSGSGGSGGAAISGTSISVTNNGTIYGSQA